MRNHQITNAALILLGRTESIQHLTPFITQITWILKDNNGAEKDYKHFYPPLLLAVDKVFQNIRNITIREMPDGTLFPQEIDQYDPWVIREALLNCIAHQDYSKRSRISVIEFPDKIIFSNAGAFLPGSLESVLNQEIPTHYYANQLLCTAMVDMNLIDTIGSGIK